MSKTIPLSGRLSIDAIQEGIMCYPCSGGQCDFDLACNRHSNSFKIAEYIKLRYDRERCMKTKILRAWGVAVAAFKETQPERYHSFNDFWEDDFDKLSNKSASELEMSAFEILHGVYMRLPVFVANGE